jgi:hypothetical protein
MFSDSTQEHLEFGISPYCRGEDSRAGLYDVTIAVNLSGRQFKRLCVQSEWPLKEKVYRKIETATAQRTIYF